MEKNAPEKYHEDLRPQYRRLWIIFFQIAALIYDMLVEFGCKRLIVDTGYYECLHQPNVDISKDPILEINETGIVTKNSMYIVLPDG